MEPRSQRFAIAAALLLAGALFAMLLAFAFESRPPTGPPGTAGPPAPARPVLVVTQMVLGGPIVVATQTPAGGLVVITQFPLPQVRQARPTHFEDEFLYDAVRPRHNPCVPPPAIPDLLELRGRGHYDLIDFRYKPELPSKEQP